jgi:dynein heavy chain 1
MLAVLLAQAKLRGVEEITDELEFLLDSGEGAVAAPGSVSNQQNFILSAEQSRRLENYAKQSIFKPVREHLDTHQSDWIPFLESGAPEAIVPSAWEPSTRKSYVSCYKIKV